MPARQGNGLLERVFGVKFIRLAGLLLSALIGSRVNCQTLRIARFSDLRKPGRRGLRACPDDPVGAFRLPGHRPGRGTVPISQLRGDGVFLAMTRPRSGRRLVMSFSMLSEINA